MAATNYTSVAEGGLDALWEKHGRHAKAPPPERIGVHAAPWGGTDRAIVYRCLPGDSNVVGSGSGERCETMTSEIGGADGDEVYVTFGVWIDPEFGSPSGGWNNFVQTHAGGGPTQSPWQLNLIGDEARLAMRIFGGSQTTLDAAGKLAAMPPDAVQEWIQLGPLPKGTLHRFACRIRYGSGGSGETDVWFNGERVISLRGKKLGYKGDRTYWKQGFYRAAYAKPSIVWFSDTKTHASLAEALARFGWSSTTTPAPVPSPFVVVQSIADGDILSGRISWNTVPSGRTVDKVEFFIDGTLSWTERFAPYIYNGDAGALDTTKLADGEHTLAVKVYATDGSVATDEAIVSVLNMTTPKLRLVSETADTVTLGWDPDPEADGYLLYEDGVRVSRTFKADADRARFAKGHSVYAVEPVRFEPLDKWELRP